MRIGELARAAGAKVETVRYYESVGLLGSPARTESNYRVYGQAQLDRLSFIRRARALGFSLGEVRQLLNLADDRRRSCEAVDALARGHRAAVDRKIADLQVLRRELDVMVETCPSGVIGDCRIIEALGSAKVAQSAPQV